MTTPPAPTLAPGRVAADAVALTRARLGDALTAFAYASMNRKGAALAFLEQAHITLPDNEGAYLHNQIRQAIMALVFPDAPDAPDADADAGGGR